MDILPPPLVVPVEVDAPLEAITPTADPGLVSGSRTALLQIALFALGSVALLYFARPVLLPVFLACIAGMALKPLVRWLGCCHVPSALGAAIVLCVLVVGVGVGFFELGRPALMWMNEAPQHMTELRHRTQTLFPRVSRFTEAAAAVTSLGATEEEKRAALRKTPV